MFERLTLKDFGRFANTELELDRTTLVVGGNESGKTTVFDAITSCLSPESVDIGRYGEHATAQLDGPLALANDGDLDLLHTVPEQGCRFVASDNEAVDARLRAGLVALRAVANQLAAMASDADDSPHNRDVLQLRGNLDALGEQWQQVWHRRCELLANVTEAERLTRELDTIDAQITHQRERANLLAAQLEDEHERGRMCARRAELLAQRQKLMSHREELVSHREDEEALAGLQQFSDSALAQLDALQQDLSAHLTQIDTIEARQANGRQRLGTIATEIAEARTQLPATKRAAERATATRLRLERFLAQPKQVERQVWRGGRVLAAMVFFAAGMVCAAFLAGTVHFVGLGLGMMLGTCTLALGRQTIREEDSQGEALFVAQLCEEWNREAGLPRLTVTNSARVVTFCDENIRAYQALTTTLDQHVTYKTRVEEELAHILDRSYSMLIDTLPTRQQAVDAWMEENDATSREQYAECLRQRKTLEARLVARQEAGNPLHDADQLTALEAALDTEIEALAIHDRDGPPKTEDELEALAAQQRGVLDLCAQLAARRQELEGSRDSLDVADPRDLASVLHRIEQEQQRVETTITEIENDKQTAAAAHGMVANLANSPDLHWQLLNETLASMLASAGLDGWQVSIDGLAEEMVRVIDPQGQKRTLATLGSGSHDLVALACRLALAAELHDALPLLVLEDPFARMDQRHTLAAVELLHTFQERTAWQIVLISRAFPPESNLFADARVIDLDRI